MSVTGKEYKLAIRIAGVIDKSFSTSLVAASGTLRKTVSAVDKDFTKLDRGFDAIMGFGSKAFHAIATAATVAATAIGAATMAARYFPQRKSEKPWNIWGWQAGKRNRCLPESREY